MKAIGTKLVLLFSLLLIFSCSSDDDTPTPEPEVINNPDQNIDQFIWQGLNAVYLYKADVNNLANDRFATDQDLFRFLADFDTPEATFDGLLSTNTLTINNQSFDVDPFSFIVDDYVALEQAFSGVSKSNGMDFGLILVSQGSSDVLGFVRLVLPGTDAEAKGLTRGVLFNAVNGVRLTTSTDFNAVFSPDTYSIDLVTFSGGTVTPTGSTISLTKAEYTENPIFISKTIDHMGQKIGYLMYNSFVFNFDEQLNDAFAQFQADGITDLVLDLRYNGGGRVSSAIILSSLISGTATDQVFSTETWNAELQADFQANNPGRLVNNFTNQTLGGTALNTLGLNRVYVLTTSRSASASELVINGLEPYIDVIQIGGTTSGKYQASITLYDSDGFGRNGANLDQTHTYAIQPLVLKSANADGVTDYAAGLFPDIALTESVLDLGVLGDVDERFLKAALDNITGVTVANGKSQTGFMDEQISWDPQSLLPTYQKMYIDVESNPILRGASND